MSLLRCVLDTIQDFLCELDMKPFMQIKIISFFRYTMWFWSVSWSTNCPIYFSFFWSTKKRFVQSHFFFVHSLEFFVQSFSKNEKLSGQLVGQETDQKHIFKKDWTKNSREFCWIIFLDNHNYVTNFLCYLLGSWNLVQAEFLAVLKPIDVIF